MRVGWMGVSLLFSCLVTWGCARAAAAPAPAVPARVSVVPAGVLEVTAEEDAVEEEEDDDAEAEADRVRPCDVASVDHDEARAALDALDTRIAATKDADDPTPLAEAIESLLAHPCFELAASDPHEPLDLDSGLALRAWWTNGGRAWLASYLELAQTRQVVSPPTPRRTLTALTVAKDHPLAPLLCASIADDAPCGRETTGWMRRADEKLILLAERGPVPETDCAAEAKKEKRAERYTAFRACDEGRRRTRRALPLGRFRAPADGWLAFHVAGGRCATLSAYDLTTGSTYRVRECSGAKDVVTTGRVPLAAIREAALMLMLAGETQQGVRESHWLSIPDGIPIVRDRGETIGLGMIGTWGGHWEEHTWAWLRDPKRTGALRAQIEGTFRRPPDEGFDHALSLLAVADDAIEPGCTPASPPARIVWGPVEEPARRLAGVHPPSRACTSRP